MLCLINFIDYIKRNVNRFVLYEEVAKNGNRSFSIPGKGLFSHFVYLRQINRTLIGARKIGLV